GMLQCILGCVHRHLAAFLEISVERGVHAAEQGRGHGGAAELAVLDGIDPGWHPTAADKGLVRFGLVVRGTLHRGIVQPNVRDVKASEDAIWCRLPGYAEQYGLPVERFL